MHEEDELAAYLLDNYGTCTYDHKCSVDGCRKTEWIGRLCPNWRPLGARTLDDLRAIAASEKTRRNILDAS